MQLPHPVGGFPPREGATTVRGQHAERVSTRAAEPRVSASAAPSASASSAPPPARIPPSTIDLVVHRGSGRDHRHPERERLEHAPREHGAPRRRHERQRTAEHGRAVCRLERAAHVHLALRDAGRGGELGNAPAPRRPRASITTTGRSIPARATAREADVEGVGSLRLRPTAARSRPAGPRRAAPADLVGRHREARRRGARDDADAVAERRDLRQPQRGHRVRRHHDGVGVLDRALRASPRCQATSRLRRAPTALPRARDPTASRRSGRCRARGRASPGARGGSASGSSRRRCPVATPSCSAADQLAARQRQRATQASPGTAVTCGDPDRRARGAMPATSQPAGVAASTRGLRELAGGLLERRLGGRDELVEHHAQCRRHRSALRDGVGVGGCSVCCM